MGLKQRREREKQRIRQSILSAARQIAAEEGWQAVTTRKVAEQIEYSQSTIYEYFENKEAILLALLRSGYAQLVVVVQAAFASTDDPEARLLAMTEAYWDFAFRSPELGPSRCQASTRTRRNGSTRSSGACRSGSITAAMSCKARSPILTPAARSTRVSDMRTSR